MQQSVKAYDVTLHDISFKKAVVKFGDRIKDKYPQLAQMLLNYSSLLRPHVWVRSCFCICLIKTMYCIRLNSEAGMSFRLSSVRPDFKSFARM